ncbi:CapA family protein [Candidatus Dojkabacteria bacterium]|nr:CapA family protein [Candidatus Dojkabacteria bacterium]
MGVINISSNNIGAKITPKKKSPKLAFVAIIIVVLILAVFLTIKYIPGSTQKNSDNKSDNHNITVFFDESTPESIRTAVNELAQKYDWSITEKKEDSTLQISSEKFTKDTTDDSNKNPAFNLYQILVITKAWNNLLSTSNTITNISEKIDFDSNLLIEEPFSVPTDRSLDQQDQLHLVTLSELDNTRIAIPVNGHNFFDQDLWLQDSSKTYPMILNVKFSTRNPEIIKILRDNLPDNDSLTNLGYMIKLPQSSDFVSIIKTGTSVIGGPGWTLCEQRKGIQYPILEVKDTVSNADFTIISNEGSFVEGCTQSAGTTAFCGKPTYLQNMLDIGTDIVSLTGNHMADYGKTAFSNTLATYRNNNINYYAGGDNLEESWKPLYIETSAGIIAFLGYNNMGPSGVLSGNGLAGTAYFDVDEFTKSMDEASQNADIIWVDSQLWPEYGTTPTQEQIDHADQAIDLGADIVTGVSSHEIQGITYYNDKPVFYGLGNFLFDQMWSTETRQGIVLKVIIYDKEIRYIELMPTMMYDYCQPRFQEGEEKDTTIEYILGISDL